MTSIGDGAFNGATSLTTVNFAAGSLLNSIGNGAFRDATLLSSITIPAGVTSIGTDAFNGTAVTSITIPDGVSIIQESTFRNASALTSITIPAGVTSIDDYAFKDAGVLADFYFLGNAPSVGTDAFKNIASGATAHINTGATASFGTPLWNGLNVVSDLYVVTYNTGGGTALNSGWFAAGGAIAAAPVTTRPGSTFVGWSTTEGKAADKVEFPYTPGVTANITLHAIWTITSGSFYCATGLPYSQDNSPYYQIQNSVVVANGGSCAGAVVIPSGVTTINSWAFSNSTITSITIPASVTNIDSYAFRNTTSLATVTFAGESLLTNIGSQAFYRTALTSITIPASVTRIEEYAFNDATVLASVTFAEGSLLNYIEENAFNGATSLTSFTIPAGVTRIENDAFRGTNALTSILVDPNNQKYSAMDGVLFNEDKTKLFRYPSAKSGSNYEIPSTVISIGRGAFQGVTALESIVIPPGVTNIGEYAFEDATALASINIPAGVKKIDYGTFQDATSLASITFAAGSVLTSIEDDAFEDATALASITIPAGVTNIGSYAFGDTSLASITIPAGVTEIQYSTFRDATSLASIVFAEGSLLSSIEENAFNGATSLTSFTIPAGVTRIENDAFDGTTALTSIMVDPSNEVFSSIGGVLFNKNADTVIKYPVGRNQTSYSIPSTVVAIGRSAFRDATSLTSVTFAEGSLLTYIEDDAFNGATSLTSITIPAGVTTIGGSAFRNATALTSVTIPASVTGIQNYAFKNASALSLYFLGDAPSVGYGAFSDTYGATAHVNAEADGFGELNTLATEVGTQATWNGLNVVPDLHLVDYLAAGGTAINQGFYIEGGSIETKPVSTRPGYTFAGWSTTLNAAGIVSFPYFPGVSESITLNAIWTQVQAPAQEQAPAQASAPEQVPAVIASYAATFSAGSTVITRAGKAEIKKIVSKTGKGATYTVTGVASKFAGVPDSRTKALAKARAERVKAYLIQLGVNKSNISIKVEIVKSGVKPKTKISAK